MQAHRPGRPEDLPHPDVFWSAGTALAMFEALKRARFPRCRQEEGTVRYESGGGSWWELARIEGGRAVLYGEDADMSDGKWHTPPVDFLSGGPDWLPWETLADLEKGMQLGYVYWWEESVGWARAPYPDDLKDDGLGGVVMDSANRQELLLLLGEDLPEDADAEAVLRHIEARTLTPELLARALGPDGGSRLDLGAGLDIARRTGVLAGTSRPELPPGTGAPDDRRHEKLSLGQHDALVHAAMLEATELERPEPVPDTALRAELAERLRAGARHGDGRAVLLAEVSGGTVGDTLRHPLVPRVVGRDVFGAVERLCAAESAAHPERGRPLFLRAETTPDALRIDTAYDAIPDWWDRSPYRAGTSVGQAGTLRHEMARRAPEWRPRWAELLDPDIRCDGPPGHWAHLPIPRTRAELWGR